MTESPKKERPRRVRGLLSAYYGLSEDGGGIDDTNMDSPHFNAKKYVEQLVKEKPLEEILAQDASLVQETRTLDSELQSLVYENYNKFISATDTIRKMKDNVESMEDKMDMLQKSMETISTCTNEITDSLAARRSQIERLVGVNQMLKKIQFIVELPQTLRKCIEMKTFGAAVNYYNIGSAILKKYAHIKSFHRIQEDSAEVMEGLKKELRLQVTKPLTNSAALSEVRTAAELLRQLSPDNKNIVSELRELLVTPTHEKLNKDVEAFHKHIEATSTAQCGKEAALQLPAGQVLTPALKFPPMWMKLSEIVSNFSQDIKCALSILDENIDQSRRRRLGEITKETMSKSTTAIINQTLTHLEHCLGIYAVQRLDKLKAHPEFTGEEQQPPPLESSEAKTATGLKPLWHVGAEVARVMSATWKALCESLKRILPDVSVPADQSHYVKFMSVCCSRLLNEVLKWINSYCLPKAIDDGMRDQKAKTLLCTAVFLQELSTIGIQTFGAPIDHSHKVGVDDLSKAVENTLRTVLNAYAKLEAQTLSSLVSTGIDRKNWLHTIETEKPDGSVMIKILTEHLNEVDSAIMDAIEKSKDTKVGVPADDKDIISLPTKVNKNSSMIIEVRIFNKSILVFRPKKLERLVILDSVVNSTLKTYLECIRVHTFNQPGFNQIYTDCTHIGKHWFPLVSKPKSLGEALDEVVNSCNDRTLKQTA